MHHDQIMESYTPLNNYLSNCVIKLHIMLQSLVHGLYVNRSPLPKGKLGKRAKYKKLGFLP
jgi:hypothetical protein